MRVDESPSTVVGNNLNNLVVQMLMLPALATREGNMLKIRILICLDCLVVYCCTGQVPLAAEDPTTYHSGENFAAILK